MAVMGGWPALQVSSGTSEIIFGSMMLFSLILLSSRQSCASCLAGRPAFALSQQHGPRARRPNRPVRFAAQEAVRRKAHDGVAIPGEKTDQAGSIPRSEEPRTSGYPPQCITAGIPSFGGRQVPTGHSVAGLRRRGEKCWQRRGDTPSCHCLRHLERIFETKKLRMIGYP